MSIPYVLAMVRWTNKMENESSEPLAEIYEVGKRMVIFAMVFDELLDAVLMEKYIQYPAKRWCGLSLNAASNLGLALCIFMFLSVAANS